MDTSTFRWILVVVGVIILASIPLFWNRERRRKPKASRRVAGEDTGRRKKSNAARREPTLGGRGESAGDPADDAEPTGQGELDIDAPATPAAPRRPAGPPPEKIVSLFLLARDNHVITGAELLQATVSTGMDFGDMNIFHRLPEGSERPVFSLANAAKPGHFERDEWNTFETQGVVLFLALPGPVDALDAWDSMLATGRRMAEILNAEILDGEHNPFTRQREAQIREELRDYDRSKSHKN